MSVFPKTMSVFPKHAVQVLHYKLVAIDSKSHPKYKPAKPRFLWLFSFCMVLCGIVEIVKILLYASMEKNTTYDGYVVQCG